MSWIIGLLSVALVLDCLLLILLVLIQLPKKEAGLGQAFGGATTDALFGAGSGNVLTKLTKYAATIFFVITLSLSMLHARQARHQGGDPRLGLTAEERIDSTPVRPGATNAAAAVASNAVAALTNAIAAATNATATNAAKATNTAPAAATPAPNK